MARLAGWFGRKGNETDAGTTAPKPANGKTAVAIVSIENFSDVGSRTGEENEVLRSLLTDTGRNIGESRASTSRCDLSTRLCARSSTKSRRCR